MILVVEDDRDIREFLTVLLQAEGYEVVTASNGSQARHHLESSSVPDLILLDLMMPELDGWNLREELSNSATLQDVPIIILSGLSNLHQEARALKVAAYFKKPFDMDDLIETIRTIHPVPN